MALSMSHTVLEKIFPLFFTPLFQSIEVCGHLFEHRFLKLPPQHFTQVAAWTLYYCSTLILFFFLSISCTCKTNPNHHHRASQLVSAVCANMLWLFFTKCGALCHTDISPLWSTRDIITEVLGFG